MLSEAVRLCNEGENLRWQGKFAESLEAFQQALAFLDQISSRPRSVQAHAVFALRARAAREATIVMISLQAPVLAVYDMIATERAALEAQLCSPISQDRLHHHLSAFGIATDTNNHSKLKRITEALLKDFFGVAGPYSAQKARIALIRNYLTHARVIFDREGDIRDSTALAQHALSEALALTTNFPIGVTANSVIPMIEEVLDLFAHLQGDVPSWHARAQVVRTLLPIAPNPWSMALMSTLGIAALFAGLGMPGDRDWFYEKSDPTLSDLF
jgi:hypothetical protein